MNDLIEVGKSHIAGAEVQTANARDLHVFLGVSKDFSSWIKGQIARARLVDGRDYTCSPSKVSSPSGTKHTIEYHLTLDAGKQIAMMSETDKGFQVRDYFIECERRALAAPVDPLAGLPPEQRALVALMCEQAIIRAEQAAQAQVQAQHADSIKRIEAKQSAFENGASYFTVIGYGSMRNIKFSVTEASALGRKAAALSKQNGVSVDKVRDPRFGQVNSYHESMLDKALETLYGGM